jgi:SAM-dependent methyltransferase
MAAFDQAAPSYDRDFTAHPIAVRLRKRTWERLDKLALPGSRVLEIGCGTGEDALHLAERGVEVVAVDASQEMLRVARRKTTHLELTFTHFDLNDSTTWAVPGTFDGVFSSFGPLNCLTHWPPLVAWLAEKVRPGGWLCMGVMSRFYPWETLWHGMHGNWGTAFRRWKGYAVLPGDSPLRLSYPTPGQLEHFFRGVFCKTALLGLGGFLPPSDVYGVIEARPRLLRLLTWLEEHSAPYFPFRALSDHYWLEMVRC